MKTELFLRPPPAVVTAGYLATLGACRFGVDGFLRKFPDGMPLTRGNVLAAYAADLAVVWAFWKTMTEEAYAEFEARHAKILRSYDGRRRQVCLDYSREGSVMTRSEYEAAYDAVQLREERETAEMLCDLVGLEEDAA